MLGLTQIGHHGPIRNDETRKMRYRPTLLKAYTKIKNVHLACHPCVPRNNMSMLSTFHSRKPNHEETQKFD